jgi:hypothetical protein
MILCGLFGLFMFRLVGFFDVPRQIVISGLAIGAGTSHCTI